MFVKVINWGVLIQTDQIGIWFTFWDLGQPYKKNFKVIFEVLQDQKSMTGRQIAQIQAPIDGGLGWVH